MSRIRTLFSIVLPSMIAGGLVFSNAFGHAAANGGPDDGLGFWPTTADSGSTTRAVRARRPPPAPPAPPASPAPPMPPMPPQGPHGVSVSVKDGKVRVDGVDRLVRQQIDAARQAVKMNPNIPPDVRARVLARLDKVKVTVDRRLANLKVHDMDQLGEQLEQMGEEIEEAMEGLEEDLAKLGPKVGQDLGKDFVKLQTKLGKDLAKGFKFDFDFDDDHDDDLDAIPMTPDLDSDDADLGDAIDDLKGLALRPAQRDAIAKLRADSDRNVAAAKKQIDDTAGKLEAALADARSSDHDIAKYVDQISQHEAAVRKARILAWVNARRVLDDDQRKKIEAAAAKKP